MSDERPAIEVVVYLNATPVRVWQALTDPELTARYWGHTFATDWQVGSEMSWGLGEGKGSISDPEQRVLAAEPPRELAYTWHTFTEEWAKAFGQSELFRAQAAQEPRSRVRFSIEPVGPVAKLTVVHDGFADRKSVVYQSCREGWPYLLSDLKTLLETGSVMPRG